MFEGITGEKRATAANIGFAGAASLPSADIDAVISYAKGTRPATSAHARTLLFVSAAAFVLAGGAGQPFTHVLVLLAVVVFHELGHVLAMHLFHYQDVRFVFLPWIGSVASGRAMNAPAWQRAVVLLAGPLPGLVASGLLLISPVSGLARLFAAQLAFVNALNLLPFYPLDGGGFVQQLFASRPRVQVWVGSAGLLLVSIYLVGWIICVEDLILLFT